MRKGFLRFLTVVFFLVCLVGPVSGATIDVMIVYDTTARSWVSSQGGMSAFAADAVARMNQAMANSNVNLTFRLVHTAEVSYTYSGSFDTDTDLVRLQAGTGNLSIVHQWRDTYGADVVALLVDTGSAYGTVGWGYLLDTYMGDPAYAFTANAIRSVDISHTLTHEVGHNLGCHHSKYQKSSPGPNTDLNSYSAGWYFTGTNAIPYHTIMAYGNDGYGHSYVEAPLFSTPLLTYQGTPAGHAQDGDNARNIRTTMDIVAAYRSAAPLYLYFPHVATSLPWQTEIAIINTSDQTVTGRLRALSNGGQPIDETRAITLSARGRRQIIVADEFANHTDIRYIVFETDSAAVQGYSKYYIAGTYRAAIPAVKTVNTANIYIPHIASNDKWCTAISLLNTTSAPKELTITFSNRQTRQITLNANEHTAFMIESLFNNQPQPDIKSAVIITEGGVIGLVLFGNIGGNDHMDGILLTGNTASTLYYPHVASDHAWWTGIVAYNPSTLASTMTITPYSAEGVSLTPKTLPIGGKEKYIDVVSNLSLPAGTAWFKIESTPHPLTGFELFATHDGSQLAAYAGGGGTGAREGVFAKIETSGWTGIAFVNVSDSIATITLEARDNTGTIKATRTGTLGPKAKAVYFVQDLFPGQNIGAATYVRFTSNQNVVGFQLNGSTDGMMLDGLPVLGGTN